jgi:hypothetical protein
MWGSLFALTLAAAPKAMPATATRERVQTVCLLQAADPKNPWALAHGITGVGPDFAAADGRKASVAIVRDFLLKNTLPDAGQAPGAPFGFLKYSADGTPVEPHTNLLTKTLVLAGLKPQTSFEASFGKVTLQQLIDSVKIGFRHTPRRDDYWRDAGWTLDLLSHVVKPGSAERFLTDDGKRISLDEIMDEALAYLDATTQDLQAGLDKGLAEVPKRKQGLYAHSCGGLHLVQAVFGWARFPAVRARWGARYTRQIDVLFYRLDSERRQYDAAYQQALASAPQYKVQILAQMLKFYGHFLETTGRLREESGWVPTPPQILKVNQAIALLDDASRQLEEAKAFETMNTLKKTLPQVYLDLIGDSCHASHGLNLWR